MLAVMPINIEIGRRATSYGCFWVKKEYVQFKYSETPKTAKKIAMSVRNLDLYLALNLHIITHVIQ